MHWDTRQNSAEITTPNFSTIISRTSFLYNSWRPVQRRTICWVIQGAATPSIDHSILPTYFVEETRIM